VTAIVVDASRIGNVVLPDERNTITNALGDLLLSSRLVEPAHWPIEVANLIVKASRRGRLSAEQRDEAREAMTSLFQSAQIEAVSYIPAAWDVAVRYHIGVYDAAYLDLSLRSGLPLLTSDGPLAGAAKVAGVELITLE
jgi:predicted nucleic acid-binding protein